MIALIQRVTSAGVSVEGRVCGAIGAGLLALIGVERADGPPQVARLLERLLDYRVFADEAGRMNRSLRDTGGALLLVPQFTLAADTSSGTRPGFSTAAEPDRARALYGQLLAAARAVHREVASGEFGAHMQVSLTNDGPVTFWLES
ncbi:MAG: D-tyrosyl-tRNA(Tyr) deacylase [Gammaproteobacteria bacterium]|nr:D-tyrosyl-tRNA(Tyr) deacylase [Gammaproteobacteria bacterium]MDE2251179.1 D-tyrosyl-tRNA(Tyr) deacylase [Gammaproteobacteria bacterium]